MLRRLGIRLTLINVLISGVILLTLALVGLRMAENVMTAQYENDLKTFSAQIVKLAVQTASDSSGTRIHLMQVPSKYAVYISDKTLGLSVDGAVADDAVKDILPDIFARIRDEVSSDAAGINADNLYLSVAHWQGILTQDSQSVEIETLPMTFMTFTAREPYFCTIDGTPYRVSASMIGGSKNDSLMLVMQNRTDEINSRDGMRWMFAFCIAGGLVLIVLASLFLSSRAIRPVEASIRQQREFVAAASHELRTPVAAISANAEVLRDAALGEFTPFLDSIQTEGERMTRLISDLFILARADAGELPLEKTLIDAGEIAGEAVRIMTPLAEKHGLKLHGATLPALIAGDADRMRQVLLALLDNALRYTPEGGAVTVTARRSGRHVVIAVEDTGIGIPDEHKARVFDRFYRVDTARARAHGGAGLGLSVAAQYVRQMGGTIQVFDREGGGCVFEMRFYGSNAMK